MATIRGGDRLEAALRDLAAKVARPGTLRVGFLEGTTYPDGTSVPMVAATNEFGGTVPERTVPEHETTIYRRVDKNGDFLNDAKFVKRSKSNFATTHTVPEHVIPEHTVPSRPFFRRMVSLGVPHWAADLARLLKLSDYLAPRALALMGEQMKGELVQSITDQVYQPLARSTVARKGFDTTLLDTGVMKNSVDAEVTT